MDKSAYVHYPDGKEIEKWIEDIWRLADQIPLAAEILPDSGWRNNYGTFHMTGNHIVKFEPEGMNPFYGVWQPALRGPSPLVVHLPGYGAELSCHPDVAFQGYNVLNLSPLGYWTPEGYDLSMQRDGNWPVLPDTIRTHAQGGYKVWLLNCIMAVKWAWMQNTTLPGRVSFYGTSQGGGGSLLLGSIFKGKGIRCVAADEPFLTDYPKAAWRGGAYSIAQNAFYEAKDKADVWHSLGFVDTVAHASRMTYPVLLTEGGSDDVCPPETVDSLYEKLPFTKSKVLLAGRGHGYNYEFIQFVCAWFRLYA